MATIERRDKQGKMRLTEGQSVIYAGYIATEVRQVRKRKRFAKRYLIGGNEQLWVRRD